MRHGPSSRPWIINAAIPILGEEAERITILCKQFLSLADFRHPEELSATFVALHQLNNELSLAVLWNFDVLWRRKPPRDGP
jgi:hypothetical protein